MSLHSVFKISNYSFLETSIIKNFTFDCGLQRDLKISFHRFGNPDGNVIVLFPPLSASSKAIISTAEIAAGRRVNQVHGWWQELIKPEGIIDLSRFQIVCFDHLLGRSFPEFGALSTIQNEPELLGLVSPFDTARVAAFALRQELQVEKIQAVIGCSLGGNVASAWAEAASKANIETKKIISVAGGLPNASAVDKYFRLQLEILQVDSVEKYLAVSEEFFRVLAELKNNFARDSDNCQFLLQNIAQEFLHLGQFFLDQNEFNQAASSAQKLIIIRKLGFLCFLTAEFFDQKAQLLQQKDSNLLGWYDYHAKCYARDVSCAEAFSLISQLTSEAFTEERLVASFKENPVPFLYQAIADDWLFTPQAAAIHCTRLGNQAGISAKLNVVKSSAHQGHDFFLAHDFVKSTAACNIKAVIEE